MATYQAYQQQRLKKQGRCVACWKPRGDKGSSSRCAKCLAKARDRYRSKSKRTAALNS